MRNVMKAAARRGLQVLAPWMISAGALALSACGDDGGGATPVSDVDAAETSGDVAPDGTKADGEPGDEGSQGDTDEDVDAPTPDALEETLEDGETSGDDGETVDEDAQLDGDSGPALPCGGCEVGFVCIDDACVSDCGDDVAALTGDLSDAWRIAAVHCQSALGSVAYRVLPGGRVLELLALEADGVTTLTLVEWQLATGPNEVVVRAQHTVAGSMEAWEVFPGYYVAADDAGTVAYFGYSLADFSGAVVRVDLTTDPATVTTVSAPGNYDVAVLDATTILVNGVGAAGNDAGQGVYRVQWVDGVASATRVVAGLGFASGHLALQGDRLVAGGFADPWPSCEVPGEDTDEAGGKVFGFGLAAALAQAGGEPFDAACQGAVLDVPGEVRFHTDGRLLAQDLWAGLKLAAYTLADGEGGLVVGGVEPIVLGDTYEGGRSVPDSGGLLLTTSNAFVLALPAAP